MPTRRAALGGLLGAGLAGVAGCLGGRRPVEVLAAGSLQRAVGDGLPAALETPVQVDTRGSAAAARLVAEGAADPDLVVLADPVLFETVLSVPWYARVATNALVLAYNPDTDGGRRVGRAGTEGWWRPLAEGAVRLGRTDPDHDPLGYRTLFALELAGEHYPAAPALRSVVPSRRQVYPETTLLAQFETGTVDAAVVYRNMALERDYPYVELPAAVDLSAPALADRYATVSHRLPDGTVVRGAPIAYAATVRRTDPRSAVRDAFGVVADGRLFEDTGFGVPRRYPRVEGDGPRWARG